jgi:hypothetical protein
MRPHHSAAGFRRYMQMSSARLFVLVEGKHTDAFFYGELVKPVCDGAGVTYEIVRADRFSERGGKQALLALYRDLEMNAALTQTAAGVRSWCVFYLDKDVDDLLKELVVSPHVVYTPSYNVENVIFTRGQLVRAAAAASSLDTEQLRVQIPDSAAWRSASAGRWQEFVALCLLSKKLKTDCDCNYGNAASPLNEPPDAPTDAAKLVARKAELVRRSGLSAESIDRKLRASLRLVRRLHERGQHDAVFNGKWYRKLVARAIELAARGEDFSGHALANSITAALLSTLDFDEPWGEHFRAPLRELLAAGEPAA